jgi:mono/diheme cytochrome c family protein
MWERQNTIHRIVCTYLVWASVLILCAIAGEALAGAAPAQQPSRSTSVAFDRDVKPLLNRLCAGCHGAKDPKGHLRMDTLDADIVGGTDAETWQDVLDRVNLGEMPPPKAKQPTKAERQLLVRWLTQALRDAAESKRYAGGRVVMRRLTRYEYQNTMRDLLGVDLNYAAELPPEPLSPDGFLNNGASLEMSPSQIDACLRAARLGLSEAIVSGEQPTVHRVHKEVTDVGRLPNKAVAGHKPANPEFILGIDKFPRRGEFQVRIKAGAIIPDGHDFPRLRLSLGCLPGIVHVPRKVVGEFDVRASAEDPETFTFRGRIEDFPQPGDVPFGNVDFDGMIALIDFLDADGNELRYADRRYAVPVPKKKPVKKKPAKKGAAEQQATASYPVAPPLPEGARLDIVIASVEFESPVITTWPPAAHAHILFPRGAPRASQADEARYARDVLKHFMPRAFRRPVSDAELAATATFFDAVRVESSSFEEALRETLASVLVSPHFLYIVESRTDSQESSVAKGQRLSDFELASRLSYFLWSSMPDRRLFGLAEDGLLSRPEILEQEVRRMLRGERSAEFITRFADQWFDLGALNRVAVNPEFYPDFDNTLKPHMAQQAREFLAEVVRSDSSCLDLLDSDWTMLNRPLAKHYGIAGPRSSEFERVALRREDRRGGLLGQGAFLLSNSNGETAHPIKRAVWILDRLLDSPPAPPPPDVPELDAESPDLAGLSLKQQLAAHRDKEACGNCHRGIDPWGVPLENFNAIGLWQDRSAVRLGQQAKGRQKIGSVPVDASSVLPDGTRLDGLDDLKHYLKNKRRELFARSVVNRLTAYALGRSLDPGDRQTTDELTTVFIESDFRLNQLIINLVKSDSFLTK